MTPSLAPCKPSSSERSECSSVSIVITADSRSGGERTFLNKHLASGSIWVPLREPLKPPYMNENFASLPQTQPQTVVKSWECTANKDKVKSQPVARSHIDFETREVATSQQTTGCPDVSFVDSARKEERILNFPSEDNHFICKSCDYICYRKVDFDTHITTHACEKLFLCTWCGYKSRCKSQHKRHIRTHTGEKPFVCITCGCKFTQKQNLDRHIKYHTGEKPFMCITCGCKFTRKQHLDQHILSHTGEKPFMCITCGCKFTRKQHLDEHIRTHTGKKPFVCITCGCKFTRKQYLHRHIRRHTG